MKPWPLLCILLLITTAGCKRYAPPTPLIDAPPPRLPSDWQVVKRKDLTFTIGVPPGAEVMDIPGKGSGSAGNGFGGGGLGSFLASSKDEEDQHGFYAIMTGTNSGLSALLSKIAQEETGAQPSSSVAPGRTTTKETSKPFTGDMALLAFAEGPPKSPDQMGDEVESAIRDVRDDFKIDRKAIELPVGKAVRVRGDLWDPVLNQSLTIIVYCLTDTGKSYSGAFLTLGAVGAEAGFSPKEIMSTFRVRR
jgi:hypothetical protein